jgi:hypothetical protein
MVAPLRSRARRPGVRLGLVLLNRLKCDRFHHDGAMLPMIFRPFGIYTKVSQTLVWLR